MFKFQFPEFPLGLRRRAEHGVLAAGLAAGTRGPGRCRLRAPGALAAAGRVRALEWLCSGRVHRLTRR